MLRQSRAATSCDEYSRSKPAWDAVSQRGIDRVGERSVDVAAWLHGLGLEQYELAFARTRSTPACYTVGDLKDLGVTLPSVFE
jgi:hypothetical protein